jgi:hypothetical protein
MSDIVARVMQVYNDNHYSCLYLSMVFTRVRFKTGNMLMAVTICFSYAHEDEHQTMLKIYERALQTGSNE